MCNGGQLEKFVSAHILSPPMYIFSKIRKFKDSFQILVHSCEFLSTLLPFVNVYFILIIRLLSVSVSSEVLYSVILAFYQELTINLIFAAYNKIVYLALHTHIKHHQHTIVEIYISTFSEAHNPYW